MITLLSGAAKGADAEFGLAAKELGLEQIHFSFQGHNCVNLPGVKELDDFELEQAIPFLKAGGKRLSKNMPNNSYVRQLLCRNYYQIKTTQVVYAISSLTKDFRNVNGGTGWAVAMAIETSGVPIFVFDQELDRWNMYNELLDNFEPIDVPDIPGKLSFFTGIGSRELKPNGQKAIRGLVQRISQQV